MGRYLKEAFWASARVPLLGSLPVNVLALVAGVIFGFVHPSVWLLALGLETAWLFGLATNSRFQNWADARNQTATPPPITTDPLSAEDQERANQLQTKVVEALEAYRKNQTDPLIFEANRDALLKLADIYNRLLGARASLMDAQRRTNAHELRSQLAQIERELAGRPLDAAVRGSKQATAEILRQRLANDEKRGASLVQIESDLVRIAAQVDLAVENAVVRGSTEVLSTRIELASQLLSTPEMLAGEPENLFERETRKPQTQ